MQLIEKLKGIGYEVELTGDNLKLSYKGRGQPDKDKITSLLEELKTSKRAVIDYLLTFKDKPIPFNTLWGIFKDSLKHVDNPFMDDEAWGRVMQTSEYQKAMDKVDRTWLDCQSGKTGIEDFKGVLAEWEGVIKSWQN